MWGFTRSIVLFICDICLMYRSLYIQLLLNLLHLDIGKISNQICHSPVQYCSKEKTFSVQEIQSKYSLFNFNNMHQDTNRNFACPQNHWWKAGDTIDLRISFEIRTHEIETYFKWYNWYKIDLLTLRLTWLLVYVI